MKRKIAFFDIDKTLTSEIDGSIPNSVYTSISMARENGHLMFINTGRCMQNVEKRFRDIGFDGFVCGCGTNIYCTKRQHINTPSLTNDNHLVEIVHNVQSNQVVNEILNIAHCFELDLLFESRDCVCFDNSRSLFTDDAKKQYEAFANRGYNMNIDPYSSDFTCDKFVVWFKDISILPEFCKVSDVYFDCIDRTGNFREFVPKGFSKATGMLKVLNYYGLDISSAYAFGDSNNDLPMLTATPNSIGMGNSNPTSLLDVVSFVTKNASEDGIEYALRHFEFI